MLAGTGKMKYRAGYKYQLEEDHLCLIGIKRAVDTSFIHLNDKGDLLIERGYAWDGPSGPTFDTRTFMRGSLVHDSLYQLMREGHLPTSCREQADLELWRICREDGMCWPRAWWVWKAVRWFGARRAKAGHTRPVYSAG